MNVKVDFPDHLMPEAKKIARVPADDPDAAWSYPLSKAGARRLANPIGVQADPSIAEFCLEAFAEPRDTAPGG